MIKLSRRKFSQNIAVAVAACVMPASLRAQTAKWTPSKNVEFIVPTAAGSTMDLLARLIADVWSRNSLVSSTVTVQAKGGSGGAIAWSYVSRKAGDGHFLAISGPTLLSNDILGIGDLSYKDVTPIAQLFTEYTCFVVNADGPIKSGNDLVKALKSPKPPTVGVAPGLGGSSHVALLKLADAAQIEQSKLTIVPYKGANESITAVMGNHIDVTSATMSVVAPMLDAGKLRPIAIAAPQRLEGAHADIPTWRELGFDAVEGNWRGVVGPKNLGEAEVAFWSGRLAEVVKTEEWNASLKRNYWNADFSTGAASVRFLDTQYAELRSTLANLRVGK
jgi:putative tricarboxylic transport membrane protein